MKLTIKEIAQALNIEPIDADKLVTSVEFDSRLITEGSLFVPLAGTRDGHEFVQQAIEQGAVATLWDKKRTNIPENITVLSVADVKAAFQQLAVYYQEKVAPKVVAITGSNGKTTTKDMTEAVLAQKFQTYKTQGNYNNDLGMPYTMLHMPDTTEVLILEMGMDHAGEIAFLSKLAQPDAAAITLIGEAHIENLGSRAGIAKAKMEITEGLKAEGYLVVPADEPLLLPLMTDLTQKIETFGLDKGDIHATIVEETKDQTTFTIEGETFRIPVLGSYNVKNALIAYGFGRYFGLTNEEIVRGLATFQLTKNRTQWLKASNGADVLSDVYNANPTAMGLVLDSFGRLELAGRRLAVLADMLELGPDSKQMHAQMAEHIGNQYDAIFLYGSEMASLNKALVEFAGKVYYFEEKDALIKTLKEQLLPTDTLLLKGSNGMGLAEVIAQL
uniref:UDP-N-acetylmuramoyl-tripeptide--D-alanyl-D- alanine ligase n=1 Tax=Candidatus Enterococcus willemsii TaxID=1857215 RepID=UPI00403F017B